MPTVNIGSAIDGDVLARDVVVNDVNLFGAGTVLTYQRIEILKELKVQSVIIENRDQKNISIKEAFSNIDNRFSYVDKVPLMNHVKSWIKDTIANTRTDNGKKVT